MSKLLFDEQPIVVSRELAKLIGLNEAIVLQQIHFWIEVNRQAKKNYRDGRYWTFNSMKNWHENEFSFWGLNTVRRTFENLEKKGYLIKGNFNRVSFDQTKWYTIDYEVLEMLISPICPKWANPLNQNGQIDNGKMGKPIPEISTENNTKSQSQRQTENPKPENKPDKTLTHDADIQREDVSTDKIKSTPAIIPISGTYQAAEVPTNSYSNYNTYEKLIKTNIDYDSFSDPDERKLADSLIEIILDVITTESPRTVKIGKETKSRDIVKAVYLKLTHEHIKHVIRQYRAQPRKITYKGAYMRTMLFTTYAEYEAAVVNKDAEEHKTEQNTQTQPVKEHPQKKSRFVNFQQRNIDFAELERLELEQLKASALDWDHMEQTSL